MAILLLDTSTPLAFVAVVRDGNIIFQCAQPHGNRLSQIYIEIINTAFKESGCSLEDIGSIAVGVGPGSYTGTRVATTIGKGLTIGRSIPCIGFPSCALFFPKDEGSFLILSESKFSKHYAVCGSLEEGAVCMKAQGFFDSSQLAPLAADAVMRIHSEGSAGLAASSLGGQWQKGEINLKGLLQYLSSPLNTLPPLPLYFNC